MDFAQLEKSLNYLHVAELKDYCNHFNLSIRGKKNALILRIIHFLKTGEKIDVPKYSTVSCAKVRQIIELKPSALMLKGSYKNDLKTRLFFRRLIGDYFHFTAFGIDWLEELWMQGKPPTYQEFADMWKQEYAFRKKNGSTPKAEWAYINLVKRYCKLLGKVHKKIEAKIVY
jgi:hypothetical protein